MKNILFELGFKCAQWKLRREQAKKNKLVQYWQAGAIGGATMELGYVTRLDAIKMVNALKSGPVVFIDDERGFIAFGTAPQSDN